MFFSSKLLIVCLFLIDRWDLLFSDIHLLKSSMSEKTAKPTLEQITDKLEDLEVDHQEQSKAKYVN